MGRYFGTDGFRGEANLSLTVEHAFRIGRFLGWHFGKKHESEGQLALGNIIGSNIFNITWILGVSSQVMPLNSSGITIIDYAVMIGAAILPFIFGTRGKITRICGIFLFCAFVAYTWLLIMTR